jgi:hypothetical protein
MLKTLTPQEFAQHPASKQPGASYQSYLRFVAKRRAAKLGAVQADPLAPIAEPVLREQTSSAVHAQIDPILKDIMAGTDRAAAGVESLTNTHAARLAPFEGAAKERYGRAAEGTAAVADALAGRLEGRGAEEAGGLKAKLAAIGAPDRLTQEVAGGAQQFAHGAANAGFGVDSAALDEIIGHGATAEDFAGSLPGIARIAGVRAIGDVRREGQKQLGDVRGKIPGLVSELMDSARNREVNKGIAKLGLQESTAKLAADQQAGAAQAASEAAKEADRSAQAWARIQQAGQRLVLQDSKTTFEQGVKNSKLALDEKQYKLAMQKEARLAKGVGKNGFTPAQKQNLAQIALDTAGDDLAGGTDSKGKAFPPRKPVETLRDLIAAGIPFSIAIRAIQRYGKDPNAPPEWKATLGWTK